MRHLFGYWTLGGTPSSPGKCHGTDKQPPHREEKLTRLWIVRIENRELYLMCMFDVVRWVKGQKRAEELLGKRISYRAEWYGIASKEHPIIEHRITDLVDDLKVTRYVNGSRAGQLWPQQFNLTEISVGGAQLLAQEWSLTLSRKAG